MLADYRSETHLRNKLLLAISCASMNGDAPEEQ
jgi:hypothetical protein